MYDICTNQPSLVPATSMDQSQIADPVLLPARSLFFAPEADTLFISSGTQWCHYAPLNWTKIPAGKEAAKRYVKDLKKSPKQGLHKDPADN